MPPLHLRSGALAVDLSPDIGGAITAFRRNDIPLMREMTAEGFATGNVRLVSSYPLIPYSNRIAHGRFSIGGADYQLAMNFPNQSHAIHGNAWQRAWTIEKADASAATLSLVHDPAADGISGWPFAYRAEQRFALDADGLTITMMIENRDKRPFPAGLGHHPYFVRHEGATLRFKADGVWLNTDDMLPRQRVAVPAEWDFGSPHPVGEAFVDNCFTGWAGEAEIAYPGEGVSIRMTADPAFGHLVVYVPGGKPFFAVEPVSNMNDAVNRMDKVAGHGLVVLPPGGSLSGTIRFAVEVRP